MAELTGKQLGNYRLLRLLGRGGMGDVYLGEHVYLETQAAIKVLRTVLDQSANEVFRKEARTLAGLRHPNIVQILEYGVEKEDGTPYLVMDYAPNGTLSQRHSHTPLPLTQIVSYVKQVASALQYAHDRGIIHRDVKPHNMLLGANNEILLSDFGIAVMANTNAITQTGAIIGTPTYMAPELFAGRPLPASDQYALAVAVYEWITGAPPFSGGTVIEIMYKHMHQVPQPLRVAVPELSLAVESVVLRALAKDPGERYPNVGAFAVALEQVCTFGALSATPGMPASPPPQVGHYTVGGLAPTYPPTITSHPMETYPSLLPGQGTPWEGADYGYPSEYSARSQQPPERVRAPLARWAAFVYTRVLAIASLPVIAVMYVRGRLQGTVAAPGGVAQSYQPYSTGQWPPNPSTMPFATPMPPQVPRTHFFIIYNRADQHWAEWIAWELEEAGYSVVLPAWDFHPGSDFDLEVQKATRKAERVIAVLSPDYLNARGNESRWTTVFRRDIAGKQSVLLPIYVRECGDELRRPLQSIVHIDLVDQDMVSARALLLAGVRRERRKPGAAPAFPGKRASRALSENPGFPGPSNQPKAPEDAGTVFMQQMITQLVEAVAKKDAPAVVSGTSLTQQMLPKIMEAFTRQDWSDVIRKIDLLIESEKQALSPEMYSVQWQALLARGQEGDMKRARKTLNRALALASDRAQRLTLLHDSVHTLITHQQWQEALLYINEGLTLAPNDPAWLAVYQQTMPYVSTASTTPPAVKPEIDKDITAQREATATLKQDEQGVEQDDAANQVTMIVPDFILRGGDGSLLPGDATVLLQGLEVFLSYAHSSADEVLRMELETQLSSLQKQGLIKIWHEGRIWPGQKKVDEIDRHLNNAHIIVLLVSPDFVASGDCDKQAERALARYKAEEAHVIPILLRPASWEHTPYGSLQPLPSDGRAITSWQDRDEAFLNVVSGIHTIALEWTKAARTVNEPGK